MGNRLQGLGALLFVLLWVPTIAVASECSVALLGTYRPAVEANVRLADFVPEYNPETDLLFHFREDSHTSFIVGERRVDWHPFTGHHHANSFPRGAAIISRVGATKVNEIRAAIDAQTYFHLNAGTCQHSELSMLQKHGVFVTGGISIVGTVLFDRIVTDGFMDRNGVRYPQQIIVVFPNEGLLPHVWKVIFRNQGSWLSRIIKAIGFTDEELTALLIHKGLGAEHLAARKAFVSMRFDELSLEALEKVQADMQRFEASLFYLAHSRYGYSPGQTVEAFSEHHANPDPRVRLIARTLVEEALKGLSPTQ